VVNGDAQIIAHVGYPRSIFKSSLVYNPWSVTQCVNAAVVPRGVKADWILARRRPPFD
jgi:shikimate dehydrogenase